MASPLKEKCDKNEVLDQVHLLSGVMLDLGLFQAPVGLNNLPESAPDPKYLIKVWKIGFKHVFTFKHN